MKAASQQLLRASLGPDASFRPGQWEAIEALLSGGKRLLVVQRTGWGKSLVYFIATKLLRERGAGPTLLISPLLALMRNQIAMAQSLGLRAESINSTNNQDRESIESALIGGKVDLLLVSPERLADPTFRRDLLPLFLDRASLVVVDEAHCISDWGHDFRPNYRRIVRVLRDLNRGSSVLATTATANNRVIADIEEQLGPGLTVHRGGLARESLRLSVFRTSEPAERLAWLARYLPKFPGTGVVYVLTINEAEKTALWLRESGIEAHAYHSDLDNERRVELESEFMANGLKALVATSALGMGYDKTDVGFVVHAGLPGSPIAYYQQIGRAGRSLPVAYAALIWMEDDASTSVHFAETALPARWLFEGILQAAGESPKALSELTALFPKTPITAIRQALEILDAEALIERTSEGWSKVPGAGNLDWERVEAIRAERFHELEQMKLYARYEGCRMQLLLGMLDEEDPQPCGHCDRCHPHAEVHLSQELIDRARRFLHGTTYRIQAITKLPSGVDLGRPKNLGPYEQLLDGIALSSYNEPGWGQLVKEGKYEFLDFSDELVGASAQAIRATGLGFGWLTWVPSSQHGSALERFARRLAAALGIEAVEGVRRKTPRPPQKAMDTKQAQCMNAWGAFAAVEVRHGIGLLVDDVVDSGWTLAAIGVELRAKGSGPIMPFALATARPRRFVS